MTSPALGLKTKRLARFGGSEAAARRVGVGVADKEDGLPLVADHADGEVVGGGVLAHHAGGDDKDASAGEFHFFGLALFEHDEIEGLVQLQVGDAGGGCGAIRGRRFR